MCGHYTQVRHTHKLFIFIHTHFFLWTGSAKFVCVCVCVIDGVGRHTQGRLCLPYLQQNGGTGLGESLLPCLQLLPSVSKTALLLQYTIIMELLLP